MNAEEVKQIIRKELPGIMSRDREMQKWVGALSRTHFASKATTESRFEAVIEDLKKQDKRWEENQRVLRENQQKWEENQQVLRENQQKWEENRQEWKENQQKWEENQQVLRENQQKWEENRQERRENQQKWEENQRVIQKLLTGIENVNKRHDSTLGALGARWGMNTEKSFRNAMRGILEEHFSVKVLNVTEDDPDGEVFAQPDQVELDLIIKNGLLIIVEIKSSMSRSDMDTFHRKVKFYTKKRQCQASKVMVISPMVEDRAKEIARQYGIVVYSYTEEAEI